MGAEATEKPLHPPVQVWTRGQQVPPPPRPPPSRTGSPGARCLAGCRPGPRSSVTPAGPGGRGRGGGPGRPHLPPEARTPAGPSPWRPRRPAQPEAAGSPALRGAQPAATDARPRWPPNGPWEKPGSEWKMRGREREGCLLQPLRHRKGWKPAASPGPERRRASSARDCGSTSSGCEQPLPPSGSAPGRLPAA